MKTGLQEIEKYDGEKPGWSTELDLNSRGQTRRTVAVDVIKKLTTFFAAGGVYARGSSTSIPIPRAKPSAAP